MLKDSQSGDNFKKFLSFHLARRLSTSSRLIIFRTGMTRCEEQFFHIADRNS